MESTVFTKVWSFLILNVNAVIMICVRNCRISFTLIVLFPLLLLFVDRRVHSDFVGVTPSGMHLALNLKGIDGDDSYGITPRNNNIINYCIVIYKCRKCYFVLTAKG
jgi:hypothetical protein